VYVVLYVVMGAIFLERPLLIIPESCPERANKSIHDCGVACSHDELLKLKKKSVAFTVNAI